MLVSVLLFSAFLSVGWGCWCDPCLGDDRDKNGYKIFSQTNALAHCTCLGTCRGNRIGAEAKARQSCHGDLPLNYIGTGTAEKKECMTTWLKVAKKGVQFECQYEATCNANAKATYELAVRRSIVLHNSLAGTSVYDVNDIGVPPPEVEQSESSVDSTIQQARRSQYNRYPRYRRQSSAAYVVPQVNSYPVVHSSPPNEASSIVTVFGALLVGLFMLICCAGMVFCGGLLGFMASKMRSKGSDNDIEHL